MAGKRLGKEKTLADLNEKERDGAGRGVGGVLAVLAVLPRRTLSPHRPPRTYGLMREGQNEMRNVDFAPRTLAQPQDSHRVSLLSISTHTACYDLPLTDKRDTQNAGPQFSDHS
jgi:hypothetical protein